MLSRENRLSNKEDILLVLKTGTKRRLPFASVHYIQKAGPTRAAVIVGKKVSKKAVVRNRVRRKLREALRIALPEITQGVWVVVVAQGGVEEKTQKELARAIHTSILQHE